MQSNQHDRFNSKSVEPIIQQDLLEIIVDELIDDVIEEKITGEILLEIIQKNQVSKIADENLIVHKDAVKIAEDIF